MRTVRIIVLSWGLFFCQIIANSQSPKLTKEQRKQEQKNIDSLFIVKSLPVNIEAVGIFSNLELKDSIVEKMKRKGFDFPSRQAVENLIKENMMLLPSPLDKEKFAAAMEKLANDKNYIFQLAEQADPFLQRIELTEKKDDKGINIVQIRRQNFPNGRKMRDWAFQNDGSETIDVLAARIVDTLIKTFVSQ